LVLLGCSSDASDGSSAGSSPGSDMFGNADPNASAGPGASGGSGTGVPVGAPGSTCASGLANTSPVTPTVWLVLDGSGSMDEEFDNGSSRWDVLRSSLMDDDGLVTRLQHGVRFGMVLYSGIDEEEQTSPDMCVDLVTVQPAISNYDAIAAQFPDQELGGWTPTDRALEHVVATLPVTNEQVLDEEVGPIYVILATDGAPNDHCGGDPSQQGGGGNNNSGLDPAVAQRVIAATQNGVQMGMHMFIISLAGGDDVLQQHLEEVARVTGTNMPPFVPSNRDALIATLQQIIGDATCQIQLDGAVVTGRECSGEVLLNGNALDCNSDDGWRLMNESTVQLTGSACDTFLGAQSQVSASFPCGAFLPVD
jgi:hypothetical protein